MLKIAKAFMLIASLLIVAAALVQAAPIWFHSMYHALYRGSSDQGPDCDQGAANPSICPVALLDI